MNQENNHARISSSRCLHRRNRARAEANRGGADEHSRHYSGEAVRGPITPRLVTSYNDYQRWFGDVFGDSKFLPYAANGFFENGGKRVYICRFVGNNSTTASAAFGDFSARAAGPGGWGRGSNRRSWTASTKNADGTSVGFHLNWLTGISGGLPDFDPFVRRTKTGSRVLLWLEDFDDLVTDERRPTSTEARPLSTSTKAKQIKDRTAPRWARSSRDQCRAFPGEPAANGEAVVFLVRTALTTQIRSAYDDFVGSIADGRKTEQGLAALELDPYRDVALVYAPQRSDRHTRSRAIVDSLRRTCGFDSRWSISDKGQSSTADLNPRNKIHGQQLFGVLLPMDRDAGPADRSTSTVPPGGHVLGVYARSDTERGVFKAPANEILRGALVALRV